LWELRKGAKDQTSALVAGSLRNFSQESGPPNKQRKAVAAEETSGPLGGVSSKAEGLAWGGLVGQPGKQEWQNKRGRPRCRRSPTKGVAP